MALGSRVAGDSPLAVSVEVAENGRKAGESSSSSSSSWGADGLLACWDFRVGGIRRDAAGLGRRCSMRD